MSNDKLIKILKQLGSENVPPEVQSIVDKQAELFDKQIEQPRRIDLREYIMKSKIIRIATAAVIIMAVTLTLYQIGSPLDGTTVAWGEIATRIDKVAAFAYEMKMKMKGLEGLPKDKPTDIFMDVTLSADYGMHMDAYMGDIPSREIFILHREEAIIAVVHEAKKYMRMKLTDELLEQMKKESGDPKAVVGEYTKYDYTEIGRDVINGIEVEGIETTDPRVTGGMFDNAVGRLWVDVENQLPVRLEAKYTSDDGEMTMELVIENFQWDLQLDPGDFVPEIPEDYEMMADVQMPAMDGQGLIDSLEFFAEMSGGNYPAVLNVVSTMPQAQGVFRNYLMNHPELIVNDRPSPEVMQKVMSIQGACLFYMQLVQNANEPAYYGDKVTNQFPHAVLARWKTGDDKYTVILGDLSTQEVNAERLAELEALPLNLNPQAINPTPANGAMVGRTAELSWMPGLDAVSHQLYFGIDPEAITLLSQTAESNYTKLPTLELESQYFWRVDEIAEDGTVTKGNLWSFTTGGLVGQWNLQNSAQDSSQNGNDGEFSGNAAFIDNALALDGDGDFLTIKANAAFDIQNAITVSLWIKVNNLDKLYQAIIAKGDSAWRIQRNTDTDTLEFACTGVTVPGTMWGNISGKININDQKWHHVIGVYDGKEMSLYIDGKLDVSSSASGKINTNTEPVLIGSNSQETGRDWNGSIADVRIYNYGITAEEAAELYQASSK